jgi:hypothetical protein
LSRFSVSDIRTEVLAQGIVAQISGSTLWRWLSSDAIRPWRHRSWIFPRDPEFVKKAAPVLDLYEGLWRGRPLSANEFVLSADEKTSIQARIRKHRTLPPSEGRPAYVEHEYQRGGALNYLAAWDVHRARIIGRINSQITLSRHTGGLVLALVGLISAALMKGPIQLASAETVEP